MKSIRTFKKAIQNQKIKKLTSQEAEKIIGGLQGIVVDRCPECRHGDID